MIILADSTLLNREAEPHINTVLQGLDGQVRIIKIYTIAIYLELLDF